MVSTQKCASALNQSQHRVVVLSCVVTGVIEFMGKTFQAAQVTHERFYYFARVTLQIFLDDFRQKHSWCNAQLHQDGLDMRYDNLQLSTREKK